jgi:hypothetical protein
LEKLESMVILWAAVLGSFDNFLELSKEGIVSMEIYLSTKALNHLASSKLHLELSTELIFILSCNPCLFSNFFIAVRLLR